MLLSMKSSDLYIQYHSFLTSVVNKISPSSVTHVHVTGTQPPGQPRLGDKFATC